MRQLIARQNIQGGLQHSFNNFVLRFSALGVMKSSDDHIIQHYIKNLSKNSEEIKRSFDKEYIHKFRVAYKKLRSFLRMGALGNADPDTLKIPHSVKKIYSTTGEIRDRQLLLGRIKEEKIRGYASFEMIKQVKKEMKDLQKKKDIFLSRKEFKEVEHDLIGHLPDVISPAMIEDFIHQKRNGIDSFVSNARFADPDIHSIRKNLKDILYISVIATNELKISLVNTVWNKSEQKKTDDMTDLLGSFNDMVIALSFLTPAEIKKAEEKERTGLLSIRQRWLSEKRNLKKKVLEAIHQMHSEASVTT